jgi:hypothetical protein
MEVIATANNNNKMGKSGKQRNGETNRISLGKYHAWKKWALAYFNSPKFYIAKTWYLLK